MKLLHLKINGIKNISEDVQLSFSNKRITSTTNLQPYNVKAIYGTNGAGKSAIIDAMGIYKNIILNMDSYLESEKSLVDELISKKTNELKIEVTFFNTKVKRIFEHKVVIRRESTGINIVEESLYENKLMDIFAHKVHIYSTKDGSLCNDSFQNGYYQIDDIDLHYISSITSNLLFKKSLPSIFFSNLIKDYNKNKKLKIFFSLKNILDLVANLEIYNFDTKNTLTNHRMEHFIFKGEIDLVYETMLNDYVRHKTDGLNLYVPIDDIQKFESRVVKINNFIQIFNTSLQFIEVDKKIYGDMYLCSLVFVYDGYKIDLEFESTGIKKLVKLYSAIENVALGGISFIDEFDANLHDVYYTKLIEYIANYTQGQLIFTTHNISTMNVLDKKKKAIDFLSNSKITPWIKSGNYKASNLYTEGKIQNNIFNMEDFMFLGVFDENE